MISPEPTGEDAPTPSRPIPPRQEERSVGELFSELASETSTLVRQEVQLAAREMTLKASYAARQAAIIGGGLLLGVVSLLSLIAALVFGLATMITLWKSALLVGALLMLLAALLVWKGAAALREMSLLPKQSIQSLKEDEQWVQEQVR